MLDNIISKGNHAYQFRVDILPEAYPSVVDVNILKQKYLTQICKMLTQEEFEDWLCCFEIAPNTGKHHYQCIIWHRQFLSTKTRNDMKAKYFRKNRDSKNAISFTDAKKIVNLSSYVMKDQSEYESIIDENQVMDPSGQFTEHNYMTTLTYEQISLIPKWLTKNAIKSKWKKEVEDECLLIISEDEYGRRPNKLQFGAAVLKFFIEQGHDPPSRMGLFKLALRFLPSYTYSDYMNDIGYINNGEFASYTPPFDPYSATNLNI